MDTEFVTWRKICVLFGRDLFSHHVKESFLSVKIGSLISGYSFKKKLVSFGFGA